MVWCGDVVKISPIRMRSRGGGVQIRYLCNVASRVEAAFLMCVSRM